jgi:hypothetical protein
VAEGPELQALAAKVLTRKVPNPYGHIRFVRALARRLKLLAYERRREKAAQVSGPLSTTVDTVPNGRQARKLAQFTPAGLVAWANRLDFHQLETFCRRELGLPRLPVQPRPISAVNGQAREFVQFARALIQRSRAEHRAKRRAERDGWAEAVRQESGQHRWTVEDERRFESLRESADDEDDECRGDRPDDHSIVEDIERERLHAVPRPPYTGVGDATKEELAWERDILAGLAAEDELERRRAR